MRTTIRKALRWPIGASRTADHALFREGESLPGCRTAMVDQAVDTMRPVATDSYTGHRTAMPRTGQEAASAAGTRPPASPDHRWRRVTGCSRHLAGSSPAIARRPQATREVTSGSSLTGLLSAGASPGLRASRRARAALCLAAGTRRRALAAAMPRRALAAARVSAVGTRTPVEAVILAATAAANIAIEAAAGLPSA